MNTYFTAEALSGSVNYFPLTGFNSFVYDIIGGPFTSHL